MKKLAIMIVLACLVGCTDESQTQVANTSDEPKPQKVERQDEQQDNQVNHYQKNLDDMLKANPDIQAGEFNDWLIKQPPKEMERIINAIKVGHADDVNGVVVAYKSQKLSQMQEQAKISQQQEAQARAMREYQEELRSQQVQARAYAEGMQRQQDAYNAQVRNTVNDYNRQLEQQLAQQQIAMQQTVSQPVASSSSDGNSQAMSDYCSKPVAGAKGMTAKQMEICSGRSSGLSSASSSYPAPVTSSPSSVGNCDGLGCWGSDGTRYNSAGGDNYYSQDGRFCQNIGGQLQCH